jgi:hypothetical protein
MRIIDGLVWSRTTRRRDGIRRMAARLVAGSLVLAVLTSSSALALPGPQETSPDQSRPEGANGSTQAPAAAQSGVEPLPDSPGAGRPQDAQNAAGQTGAAQSLPQSQKDGNQKPVGTAAAETSTTTGFAASKPAGAALAPAKQKRARTILISVGAIAGAAVALGLVMALSKGTPSKPPGSQ